MLPTTTPPSSLHTARLARRSPPFCGGRRAGRAALWLAACVAASCGGGSGGGAGDPGQGGFQIESISVPDGAVWKINREILLDFNDPVDFSTVNLNTVTIVDDTGTPAFGEFTLVASDRVRFQPTCPTESDFTDAGLQAGGVSYTLRVLGADSGGALTVRAIDGTPLTSSQTKKFTTPNSSLAAEVFIDTVVGAPSPVIRVEGSSDENATYLELGGDADQRVYFELDTVTQTFSIPDDVPLNLYSNVDTGVAVVLELNQPVNPAADNISSDRLGLEFFDASTQSWKPIDVLVDLVKNCSAVGGATVRIEPVGILPQASDLRIVISSAFEDLIGQINTQDIDNFGRFTTLVFDDPAFTPSDVIADEVLEPFDLGSEELGSLEDALAAFAEPRAVWQDGQLSAAFEFESTGGPNGTFDVRINTGETFIFDTSTETVSGGPGFVETETVTVIDGKLNVRNLHVATGGVLQVQGVNPLEISATGYVRIDGTINIDGFDGKDVATLNTGNQPEVGAAGNAGGGRGGTANFITNSSTPKGGDGFGPGDLPNGGGKGGETGYGLPENVKDNRRPGGGGGGTLGKNESTSPGLTAEDGEDGGANATGAISGISPPQGGDPGTLPFFDADTTNDFWGTKFVTATSSVIIGELDAPIGGQGGGGGGNADPASQFPTPGWTVASDEKGAGGGGGSGVLVIAALDDIIFGPAGAITAVGGKGGSGENTINQDHLGGGSGGGSGGFVVLQAGDVIDMSVSKANCISALGGRGGEGKNGFNSTNAGGDGGPGIVQLHVLNEASDILLPVGQTLASRTEPNPIVLVPSFGSRSRARSIWIPLGGATLDPVTGTNAVTFRFDGTDTATGAVERDLADPEMVADLAPVLGPTTLLLAPGIPSIGLDGRTLTCDASALHVTLDDIYLRNPALLKFFRLRLQQTGNPANKKDFEVASATFSSATDLLAVTVSSSGPLLTSFNPGGGVDFSLIPRYFVVNTGGALDSLPDDVEITIGFQATGKDANGKPDTTAILVPAGGTANDFDFDVADLNDPLLLGSIEFVRFEVFFDLDANNAGLSADTARPALEFLRLPFRF